MPPAHLFPLFAVHISDGVLETTWLAGGFVVAGFFAFVGAYRIRDEEIPRIALLTAAFFIASSIHIRVGPSSWHLLFNGLVGVMLGRRAGLAIPIGLGLQYFLLMHGGFYTLGINTCIMLLPALLAGAAFSVVCHAAQRRQLGARTLLVAGSLVGTLTVLATIVLNYGVLVLGGETDWSVPAGILFLLHLPVAALEGIIVGFLVSFLGRVKPDLIGWPADNSQDWSRTHGLPEPTATEANVVASPGDASDNGRDGPGSPAPGEVLRAAGEQGADRELLQHE
jgi:cobalt/nickel transport system permease protein